LSLDKWVLVNAPPPAIPTGSAMPYIGAAAPSGWVLAAGKTIGNAASGATERANADTVNLYTLLWDSWADAEAPVSTGRGASAAADFAANKTITLPDLRGRSIFGKDDMGGSAASRVTSGVSGIAGATLGKAGGSEAMHQHNHGVTDPTHSHTTNAGGGPGLSFPYENAILGGYAATVFAAATGITINNAGAGTSQNMPPAMIFTYIIKL
jgi:microcystin-dependent protein